MAKFVPDVKSKRWVVISSERAVRPLEKREKERKDEVILKKGYWYRRTCPFCLGNEAMTPPEISCFKEKPGDPNWSIRVIPNKYPITDCHEVIIHSPDHRKDIIDFPLNHVEALLKVFRERYRTLAHDGHVLIFNNTGPQSGESLVHPHSQVVVLPRQITLDVIPLEPRRNVISENKFFTIYCPDFSQWPYEVWIAKTICLQESHQEDCLFGKISDGEIKDLARIFQDVLIRLNRLFPSLSYNFYISPFPCWYLRIIPRLTERAGFELGTGLHVNFVDPAKAASDLRK